MRLDKMKHKIGSSLFKPEKRLIDLREETLSILGVEEEEKDLIIKMTNTFFVAGMQRSEEILTAMDAGKITAKQLSDEFLKEEKDLI